MVSLARLNGSKTAPDWPAEPGHDSETVSTSTRSEMRSIPVIRPLTLDHSCESQSALTGPRSSFSKVTGDTFPSELWRRVPL
jgi:hypothetical protein